MDRKRLTPNFWKKYTFLYLVLLLPIAACAFSFGKGLLWGRDCYLQHYPALAYTAQAVRRLFSGGGFRMVDLSLGQGLDTLTTLSYYGLLDPLAWPAALFSGSGVEIWYHIRMFLYIYLAGGAFCRYVRELSFSDRLDDGLLALSGLLYISSAYLIIGTFRHPFFATGALFLPLELVGVERVRSRRGFLWMTLSTAAMLVINFYFAFHITLVTVCYILVRLAFGLKERGIAGSARDGFSLLGSYLLGAMLSAVALLPVAMAFLASSRSGESVGYTQSLLHYPLEYYLKLLLTYAAPYDYAGFWSLESYSPFILMGVLLLFAPGKRENVRELRAGLLLGALFLCVPIAGKIFNGFGYVTNRWSYAFAWINALAGAWALPRLTGKEGGVRRGAFAVAAGAGAIMILAGAIYAIRSGAFAENCGILLGGLAVFSASVAMLFLHGKMQGRSLCRAVSCLLVLCSAAYTVGYGVAAAWDENYLELGLQQRMNALVPEEALGDEPFGRIDTGIGPDSEALVSGYQGTGFYWSLIPGQLSEQAQALELSTLCWTFRLQGLSGDPWLNEVAGVRASVRRASSMQPVVPAGYLREELPGGEAVYRNPEPLSLGTLYPDTMSEEAWLALDPFSKRQALLTRAVVEGGEEKGDPVKITREAIPFTVSVASGEAQIVMEEAGSWRGISGKAGAVLSCTFDAPAEHALYLRFRLPVVRYTDGEANFVMQTRTEDGYGEIYFVRPDGNFNFEQEAITAYLGQTGQGMEACQLRLREDVELEFADAELLAVPLSEYQMAADTAAKCVQWQPEIGNNSLKGSIEAGKPGILLIRMPYLEGWSAVVDGKKAEILRCAGAYMGLSISEGEHDIALIYRTPGLKTGAFLSLTAAILMGILCLFKRRRSGSDKPF